MRIRNVMGAVIVAVAMTLVPLDGVQAADAPDCTNSYLLCLNEATQETGWFLRTAMELECGLRYFGCLRKTVEGA